MFKKRSIKQGSSLKRKKLDLSQTRREEMNKKMKVFKGPLTMGIENCTNDNKQSVSEDSKEKDDDDEKFRLLSTEEDTKKFEEQEPAANFKSKEHGAIPASKNLKMSILTDFHPDVCKDFKQTGYCGYGDNCKFLHSRDDFKTGWKMNQEWKLDKQRETKVEEEQIPFKCVICKGDYKSPVITNCGHHFCCNCFTEQVRRDSRCVICKQETDGVARIAKNFKKSILGTPKQD